MIKLIVGLGNPGPQYAVTRHNAGFMIVDNLAVKLGVNFNAYKNLGEYVKTTIGGQDVFLAKPLTFMNLSGRMVTHLAGFYKIKPQEILVCFDDISINLGAVRIRKDGSAGGQNGMKNIIELFGTQDIPRLRFGVGPKPERFDSADYVLSKFSKSDEKLLNESIEAAVEAAESCVKDGLERAMNKFNK
ncbi:Aminoacyl-tRNA hydrolase [Elusimicrobium minutum Pei191]|uniref:Peptidyl-tRNA hydrolase n=1 Tax=Elusimicrobium minutum (strain Pei191) TaxID=445932 RepID=PTH_ELUMP|nr:aminoacyl-tRNA hydrolase [Elusimicrobium minutum]B2KE94.1 RecName: Full=Peptidyl-tRNA hydrolase; Short=PTH [Elusimicrobium minutum Pei191]ACC98840.1 Aminoacyl-tRNA hydrolase [Elusimicrobium minutum Pei191]